MQYKFLNIFLDPKELLAQSKTRIDPFLLENNASQIQKIYEFYKSNVNLLYVNGFLGTGKAKVVNYSLAFLSTETIVLKYNCFNSTILDDMLLSFFKEFKKLAAQNIISEPKVKTENFTQRINSYFSQIEKPFVIVLNSFDEILDENRQEILDFIIHLNSLEKIKIILIGRTFESKYFEGVKVERITNLALEKHIFDKYMKSEKIKMSSGLLDEFYKHTRGYYFYTKLSVKLMKQDSLTLYDFLIKLRDSFLPFSVFLGKQSLNLVPSIDRNFFWFLSMVRHPISIDLLKKLNFYNEERINFMIDNFIIIEDDSELYVGDFLKEQADESIAPQVALKIRQYIVDLYQTQLPLKPFGRDICISRQTMRKEIEYHQIFLPKKPKNLDAAGVDINYLSYSHVNDFDSVLKAEDQKQEEEKDEKKEEKIKIDSGKADSGKSDPSKPDPSKSDLIEVDLDHRKNIHINLENLPYKNVAKVIPSPNNKTAPIQAIRTGTYAENNLADNTKNSELENLSLVELLEQIRYSESNYNYTRVIDLGKKALTMEFENDYQNYLPIIYVKLAYASQKIANQEEAIKYYTLAKNVYDKAENKVKLNQVKFNMANIYYETFKIEKAKQLFYEITQSIGTPATLVVKSYIQLANIEEGLSNPQAAFDYYRLAIEFSNESMDIKVLSELYFKYALALDDKNDSKTAIEFYNKCIKLSDDYRINKFLSPTYSNIATLYMEKNDTENAVNTYIRAFEIDKQSDNIEGMYDSASKLASILQRRRPEAAREYFETALDCAMQIKDVFYIVSASLAFGDYYYDQQKNEIALKYYINALNLAQNSFSQDNINKINIRINDIKFRLGVEKFENIVEIIKEQSLEQEHE